LDSPYDVADLRLYRFNSLLEISLRQRQHHT
jgi:hypothetical protein